jgi:hypothetical protein
LQTRLKSWSKFLIGKRPASDSAYEAYQQQVQAAPFVSQNKPPDKVTQKPPDRVTQKPDKPLAPEQQKADDERKIIAKDPNIGAGYQANKGTRINEYGIPVVGGVEMVPGGGRGGNLGLDIVKARQMGAPPGQEKAWALAMQASALAPQPTGVSMGRTSYSEGAPGWEGLLSQAIASDASIYGEKEKAAASRHQTNVFAQTTRRGQDMGLLEKMYSGGQGKDLMEAEIAKAAGTAIAQGAGLWMMEYEDTPEWRKNLSGLIGNVREAVVDSGLVNKEQFDAYLGGRPDEQYQNLQEALRKSGILLQ